MNKLKIRKLKIYCPFDGKEMEKYDIADNISDYQYCYCYCKKCKREFLISISQTESGNGLSFYWKGGDTRMWDRIKKSKKEVKHE